jgi:Zn-dependent peptidase ImmA (M78 family)
MHLAISRLAAGSHADRLLDDLDGATRELLAEETAESLRELFDIKVTMHPPGERFDSSCGVHGKYHPIEPPHIEIQQSASQRRDRFTMLHEFGHDRIRRDYVIANEFDMLTPDQAYRSRELVADAIAGRLLISDDAAAAAFADGVTAPAVARLFETTNASREACAVRAADQLGQTGVVIIGRDNTAYFTAHHSTSWWVSRATPQPNSSILLRAENTQGRARGRSHIRFATGRVGPELHADAIFCDDGWIFAVMTATAPPGGGLSIALGGFEELAEVECAICDMSFEPWGQPHVCGDYKCPRGHCSCPTGPPTRRCDACGLHKAVNLFLADETVCADCR